MPLEFHEDLLCPLGQEPLGEETIAVAAVNHAGGGKFPSVYPQPPAVIANHRHHYADRLLAGDHLSSPFLNLWARQRPKLGPRQ